MASSRPRGCVWKIAPSVTGARPAAVTGRGTERSGGMGMDGIEDFGRRSWRDRTWLAAVGLLMLPAGVAAPAWAGTTLRVSVASDGTQATPGPSGSLYVAISGDGQRVAFESVARNLSGDLNSLRDVFVHDRGTG